MLRTPPQRFLRPLRSERSIAAAPEDETADPEPSAAGSAATMGKKDKDTSDEPPPLNLNIGVMGHVDSGKTSLVKALSTTLSTASLDRAPQSQARGITLDLGFSSFRAPLPEHLDGEGDL